MRRNDCRKPRGSVFDNNGYWFVNVRLPGDPKRRKYPLCAPGSDRAMRSDRPREMAVEAAHRLWERATRQQKASPASTLTVDDLCAAYLRHAVVYYRGDAGEAATCACACRTWRELHGSRPVAELVHTDMLAVRDALVRRGLARVTVNRYVGIIGNRLLPWALDEGLIRATVKAELSQVQPLKAHRSEARETSPVRPVDDATLQATVAKMMPNTADMVRVHRLTGMRPEEICSMTWADIDTSRTPWTYRPRDHKNAWRGQPRIVLIGPRARAILARHKSTAHPFSPVAAVYELMLRKREAAATPSRVCRADPHATRKPRDHWDTCSYTKTIKAACARAGVSEWSANQLRHAFATDVRRAYGIDACRAVLGHSSGLRVTDRYSFEAAEEELIKDASAAVEALG